MKTLELVYISTRLDAYGFETHDIKTIDGSYICREGVNNRKQAHEIASSIDADMIYERDNGVGSLDVS
jgi:hypothetical protein